MDAPFLDSRSPKKALPAGLTVEEAIARWRESRVPGEPPAWSESLLAPGELHGVMPDALRKRPREERRSGAVLA